jgi:hypothetical protein
MIVSALTLLALASRYNSTSEFKPPYNGYVPIVCVPDISQGALGSYIDWTVQLNWPAIPPTDQKVQLSCTAPTVFDPYWPLTTPLLFPTTGGDTQIRYTKLRTTGSYGSFAVSALNDGGSQVGGFTIVTPNPTTSSVPASVEHTQTKTVFVDGQRFRQHTWKVHMSKPLSQVAATMVSVPA